VCPSPRLCDATQARVAVGVAVTGSVAVGNTAPASVLGTAAPPLALPPVATTRPAASDMDPGTGRGRVQSAATTPVGLPAGQEAAAAFASDDVPPDTPQAASDLDTPHTSRGGGGAQQDAHGEVDFSAAEARAAEAERQAAQARAAAASALALKAASKILADRRRPRQSGPS